VVAVVEGLSLSTWRVFVDDDENCHAFLQKISLPEIV
jgi:hypothetical protein